MDRLEIGQKVTFEPQFHTEAIFKIWTNVTFIKQS